MATPRKKRSLDIVPTTSDPQPFEGEPLHDRNGDVVAMIVGDKIVPLPKQQGGFGQLVDTQSYNDAARVAAQSALDQAQASLTLRQVERGGIEAIHGDDLVFGGIREGLDKWRYDRDWKAQQREDRRSRVAVMAAIGQTRTANVAMALEAMSEQHRRGLMAAFEQQDYQQAWSRYTEQQAFAADIALKPTLAGQQHTYSLAELEANTRIKVADLEVQARAAERADEAAEADKDREAAMVSEVMAMGGPLNEMLFEYRSMDRTDDEIKATREVLTAAMAAFGQLASTLDPAEQKTMAPVVAKKISEAMDRAIKVARRHD